MPGMDGSARAFVEALDAAGVVEQPAFRAQLAVREVTRLSDGDAWIEIRPAAHGGLSARYRLDYGGDNAIGRQTLGLLVTPDSFRNELADSRTFLLKAEADWLLGQGLGTRISPRDLLIFGDDGPIDNQLRYADECVRHKVLDLVGDLALAGCDLAGHVVAHRTGHRLNAELVKVLLGEGQLVEPRRRSA
jgi:UDP-3-O-acyl-N-acetylglucosamine deacetylase